MFAIFISIVCQNLFFLSLCFPSKLPQLRNRKRNEYSQFRREWKENFFFSLLAFPLRLWKLTKKSEMRKKFFSFYIERRANEATSWGQILEWNMQNIRQFTLLLPPSSLSSVYRQFWLHLIPIFSLLLPLLEHSFVTEKKKKLPNLKLLPIKIKYTERVREKEKSLETYNRKVMPFACKFYLLFIVTTRKFS